ncbi:hypothetical protein [uncultured Alsobacter sp.]|uniref:hypothetical protein n=1 Tax=uncultured Alsobacter sp. TaxID=1748258 RepID=UPI0025CD7248|nr:hypothetical protein [uncultured Alsobacter sp.]
MSILASLHRLLRARAPWVVALCYALLLQAALAPVVRAAQDPALTDQVAAVLCLADRDQGSHPQGDAAHDIGCCLSAPRAGLETAALAPGVPIALPHPPRQPATRLPETARLQGPPSVDLPTRPARAPPGGVAA